MTVNLKEAKLLMFPVNKITNPMGATIVIISDGQNYLLSQKAVYQAMKDSDRVKNMMKTRRYDENEMLINKLAAKNQYPDILPAFSKHDSKLRFITAKNTLYILKKSQDDNAKAYLDVLCSQKLADAIFDGKSKPIIDKTQVRNNRVVSIYSNQNQLHSMRAQLDAKNFKINHLENDLDKSYHDIDRAKEDIDKYKKDIDHYKDENSILAQEHRDLTQQVVKLERKVGIHGYRKMTRRQHLLAFLFGE